MIVGRADEAVNQSVRVEQYKQKGHEMKIRSGFVSNSSSSSYVIAVGRILDETKFEEFVKDASFEWEIYTTEEILKKNLFSTYSGHMFSWDAFDGNQADVKFDPEKNQKFFAAWEYEDIEETEDGCVEPEEYDSDIFALEFCDCVSKVDVICGYGRNG